MRFREILKLYEESEDKDDENKDDEEIDLTGEQDSDDKEDSEDKEESEDKEKLSDPEDDVDTDGDEEVEEGDEDDELEDADTSEDEEEEDNLAKVNELIVNKFIKDYNKRIDYYTKQIKKVGMQVTLKKFIEALVDANTENPSLKMLLSMDTDTVMMEIEEQLKTKLADKIAEDDVDTDGDEEVEEGDEDDELEDADTSEDEEEEDNLAKVNELIVNKFIKDYNKRIDYYTKQIKKVGMQVTLKKFIEALVDANTENPSLKMLLSMDTDTVMMEIEEQLKTKLADKIAGDKE